MNTTTAEPRNALGITALALGLVGLLFGLVPFTGFIAVGLGVVGVILALANRGRLRRGTATNKKTTWSGLAVSLAAIALGIWGMVIVFGAVEQLDEDMQEIGQDMSDTLEEGGWNDWAECINSADELDDATIDECRELRE